MKSDKKKTSIPSTGGRGSDRQEREAAALRANLRRRKQQQQARQVQGRLDEPQEDEDDS